MHFLQRGVPLFRPTDRHHPPTVQRMTGKTLFARARPASQRNGHFHRVMQKQMRSLWFEPGRTEDVIDHPLAQNMLRVVVVGGRRCAHIQTKHDTEILIHSFSPRERTIRTWMDPRGSRLQVACTHSIFVVGFKMSCTLVWPDFARAFARALGRAVCRDSAQYIVSNQRVGPTPRAIAIKPASSRVREQRTYMLHQKYSRPEVFEKFVGRFQLKKFRHHQRTTRGPPPPVGHYCIHIFDALASWAVAV